MFQPYVALLVPVNFHVQFVMIPSQKVKTSLNYDNETIMTVGISSNPEYQISHMF